MLITFQSFDFSDGYVENVVEPDNLGRALQNELELRFTRAQRTHNQLGVEIISDDQTDSTDPIGPADNGAIAAVICSKPRLLHVTKHQGPVRLVLKADGGVYELVSVDSAGAEACDCGGEVVGVIAERLSSACAGGLVGSGPLRPGRLSSANRGERKGAKNQHPNELQI